MQRQCPRILNYAAQLLSLFFLFFENFHRRLQALYRRRQSIWSTLFYVIF